MRGKENINTNCPQCNANILKNTVKSRKHINDMIKVLQIKITRKKIFRFTIQIFENKEHESNCTLDSSLNSVTLSDILNITPDSRDMEEAALKISLLNRQQKQLHSKLETLFFQYL